MATTTTLVQGVRKEACEVKAVGFGLIKAPDQAGSRGQGEMEAPVVYQEALQLHNVYATYMGAVCARKCLAEAVVAIAKGC